MPRRPRGFGHIYRHKKRLRDGTVKEQSVWWIAYYVHGKLVRESTGTSVKTEAEKLLRQRTLTKDQGIPVDPAVRRTALADIRRLVETDYRNNARASSREVSRAFDRLEEFFGGDCIARNITVERVEEYKAARLGDAAAPATVNRELAMLRRGFRLAVRFGRLPSRPDFSLLREDNVRQGFFEEQAFHAVRDHLPACLRPVATFLYWTGWRKMEALTLEWHQVDLKTGVVRIEKTKNREPRTVPYAVVPALKRLFDEQKRLTLDAQAQTGTIIPWVFHRGGEPVRDFAGAWHSACRKAGVPGRLLHDFRRTAARNMVRAGIPQNVAMKIGGWKTDSVFRRYAIVDEALLRENMIKLAALSSQA